MREIIIDKNKCIGCQECIKDCISHVIELKDNKANILSDKCIKCGHCVAICPKNAISMSDMDSSEVEEIGDMPDCVTPDVLLSTIKSLRTIRRFKNVNIDNDTISKIIEAGRYTATGGNSQNVRYIVVKDNIDLIEKPVLNDLRKLQKKANFIGKFIKFPYDLSNFDFSSGFLFKNAPVVIIAISKSVVDASIATRSLELMMKSCGLGGLYVGFFTRFANKNKDVRKFLDIGKKEKIVTCLAIGVPDIKYYRTAPRNKANIVWK